jgi:LAO/AO transport system kinase
MCYVLVFYQMPLFEKSLKMLGVRSLGLIDDMLAGSQKALSRLITLLENDEGARQEILKRIYSNTGNAHIIGFTGPPGVGKSTLVDAVADEYIKRGKRVGIIAVDPSSPFTQGAVLGDRIRMQSRVLDKQLFIRSLASRGKLGGLSKATNDVVKLLDAYGKDVILIETVGTGQSEIEIAKMAHTTAVVLSPGYGDGIQAMKAGILEIGDVFIVNKADMDGTEKTIKEIGSTVEFNFWSKEWIPPVLPAIAKGKTGIPEIADQFINHIGYLKQSKLIEQKEKERIENELDDHIVSWIQAHVLDRLSQSGMKEQLVSQLYQRQNDPISLMDELIGDVLREKKMS